MDFKALCGGWVVSGEDVGGGGLKRARRGQKGG